MAEADESSSKGKYDYEKYEKQVREDAESHARRWKEEEERREYDKRYIIKKDKPRELTFRPYQEREPYKKSIPRFSPERLYTSKLVDLPEIRNRDVKKDYRFAIKKLERKETWDQKMIGIRNIRAYLIYNTVEFREGIDIFKSQVLDDPNITLYHHYIRGREANKELITLDFKKSPVVVMLDDTNLQIVPDNYDKKSQFREFTEYVQLKYNLAPDISTFQGQAEQILVDIKEERPDEGFAPTLGFGQAFRVLTEKTFNLAKGGFDRGLEVLMRNPNEEQNLVQNIQRDIETQTSIESNLEQTRLNLEYRDIQIQTTSTTFSKAQQTEKIKTLEKEIQVNNSEVLKIQQEKDTLEKRLQNVRSKSLSKGLYIAQLEAEIQQKQDSLDDKNIAFANANQEIDQINNQLLREQLEKVTLQDEIDFKETQLLDTKQEIDSLNEQLTEYSSSTRDYHEKVKELQDKLADERADYAKTVSEIKDAKRKLDRDFQNNLDIQKTHFEKIISDLKIKSSQDLKDWDQRRQDLEETLKKYKDEASITPSLRTKIEALEGEVNTLRGNYEALKLYSKNQDTKYLQSEKLFNEKVDELQDLIRGYVKQLSTREMEKTKYLDDIEQYKKKLATLNTQLKTQKENFQKNSNDYLLAKSKLDQAHTDILDRIEVEKSLRERETILLDLIAEKNERIEVKDKEITEYLNNVEEIKAQNSKLQTEKTALQSNLTLKTNQYEAKNVESKRYQDELEELKEKKDKLENQIDLNKFKHAQFDRLTLEYNELAKTANSAVYDKDMVQEELKEKEKKIQELKEQIIDPQILKNLQQDNKNLILEIQSLETKYNHSQNETATLKKEKEDLQRQLKTLVQNYAKTLNATKRSILKDSSKRVAKLQEEYDKTKKERDELKKEKDKIRKERDRKINNMEFEYKAKRRKLEEKLKKKVQSSDIREVGEFLSRDENDMELAQEENLKKLKAEKKKFKYLSKDKNVPLEQRLFYNKISKLLDYKIDLANIATGRPVETARGQRLKERHKKRPISRILQLVFKAGFYGLGILASGLMGTYYLKKLLYEGADKTATAANNNSKPSPDVKIKFKKDGKKGISDKSKPSTDVATRDKEQTKYGITKYVDWDRIFDSIYDTGVKTGKFTLDITGLSPAVDLGSNIVKGVTKGLENLTWFLRWLAENIYLFLVSATIITIYLHSTYGEDVVPLIIAFWATLIALVMMIHYEITNWSIWSYLNPLNWF